MKKVLFLFAALLALASCAANRVVISGNEAKEDSISIIDGIWQLTDAEEVMLYEVVGGQLMEIASSILDAEGHFIFAFKPTRPAFYVIGLSTVVPTHNYTFWFKPGDRLSLNVGRRGYVLTGNNTPENMEIARWDEWIYPLLRLSRIGSNYTAYFPLLEEKLAEDYIAERTPDAEFDAAFDHYRKSYIATLANIFLLSPHSIHPGPDDMIDFYRNFDLSDYADAQLLNFPYGMSLLKTYQRLYMLVNPDNLTSEQLFQMAGSDAMIDFVIPRLRNDELVGEFVLSNVDQLKTYEGYLDFDSKYSRYLVTDNQRERFKRLLNNIPVPKSMPAVDFRFPDVNGTEVALSDFKGKVVYIDVWATWCGPCRNQMPYLKELEAEYHDNPDMVFMSVSTDAEKDHQKWLDTVAAENLGGVQLFGGDRATVDILDPYKIAGIPRFLLVGKDGRIISDDAPPASSLEIRSVLNAALAQ